MTLAHRILAHGEAKKVKCLWPSQSLLLPPDGGLTSKFNQLCLLCIQRESKLTKTILQCAQKRARFAFKLEPDNAVSRVFDYLRMTANSTRRFTASSGYNQFTLHIWALPLRCGNSDIIDRIDLIEMVWQ